MFHFLIHDMLRLTTDNEQDDLAIYLPGRAATACKGLEAANWQIRRDGNWVVERHGEVFHPLPMVLQVGRCLSFRFKPLAIAGSISPPLTCPTFLESTRKRR